MIRSVSARRDELDAAGCGGFVAGFRDVVRSGFLKNSKGAQTERWRAFQRVVAIPIYSLAVRTDGRGVRGVLGRLARISSSVTFPSLSLSSFASTCDAALISFASITPS